MSKVKFSWWLTIISVLVLLTCIGLLIANGMGYQKQLGTWGEGFQKLITNLPKDATSNGVGSAITNASTAFWDQFKSGVTNPFIFQMVLTGLVGLLSIGTFGFGLRNWIKGKVKV